MTTESFTISFGAGETRYLGQGRMWYIKSAPSGPLNLRAEKMGQGSTNVRNFVSMPAGTKSLADPGDSWDKLVLYSATAQIVEMIMGDDDVDVANAVSVTGNAATIELPCGSFTTPALATLATGAQVDIAADLTRRRITINNVTATGETFYVRDATGTADAGQPIQAGMGYMFSNTDALRIVNNSGATISYTISREA